MLAGSQVAHVFAYRWVYPSSHVRLQALVSTGHGYMDRLPLVLGIASAVAFVSLLAAIADTARRRTLRRLSPWAFALLPILTFVVQEVLERSLHAGTFVWQAVESQTFIPGVVLQLPFAAVAYVLARLLSRTVSVLGRIVGGRRGRSRVHRAPPGERRPALILRLPLPAPLAGAAAGRAPPLFVL